jgi:hypothetical protein
VPDIPGTADPDEVKLARAKYLAIMRRKWALRQRLETLEWEHTVLRPALKSFENRIVVLGELPSFEILEEDDQVESEDGQADSDLD